ncbi:MAG: Gfo/Idh/MocA family oxidoreductase [Planctomycetaceae bacterium]
MIRLVLAGDNRFVEPYARVVPHIGSAQICAVAAGDASLASRCGVQLHAADLGQLLARHAPECDAVVLDATCGTAAARLAIDAGKHVLIRGELQATQSELDALDALSRDRDLRLMIGCETRFGPALQTVKKSLTSGQIGEPGLLRIHRWEAAGQECRAMAYAPQREIDLACWLFDASPARVFSLSPSAGTRATPADYLQLHLGFPRDGMALIDISRSLPSGDNYFSLSVIGSTGAAYADDHHNTQLVFGGGSATAHRTSETQAALLAQLQEFLASIDEQRVPATSLPNQRRVLRVADAVTQSLKSQQAVPCDT